MAMDKKIARELQPILYRGTTKHITPKTDQVPRMMWAIRPTFQGCTFIWSFSVQRMRLTLLIMCYLAYKFFLFNLFGK